MTLSPEWSSGRFNLRFPGDERTGQGGRTIDTTKGLVFQIIHGSFVDGPGIQTTVFLKGCPLKCLWCCNPEGQAYHPEIKLISAKCTGCANCIPVCPAGAMRLEQEKGAAKVQIDRDRCNGCGQCLEVCHSGALDCFGKYYTVKELFEVVQRDQPFYRSTEGGVTIGGGEATAQPAFTLQFIRKCKENYIHTALDTCGYTLSADGIKALQEADLLLFDLKGTDPQAHLQHTGVSNEPILQNLKMADGIGKPIIIRLPIIPGYTDPSQDLRAAAQFLTGMKSVERVDLMFAHEYGKVKYEQLGMEYRPNIRPISPQLQKEIKEFFEGYGLNVQIGG